MEGPVTLASPSSGGPGKLAAVAPARLTVKLQSYGPGHYAPAIRVPAYSAPPAATTPAASSR